MKIAQIAPLIERVPPTKYGGTERVVYALTEELIKMGHEVTLFATGDSKTSAKLVSVYPRSLRENRLKSSAVNLWTTLNFGNAYEQQDDFDIIHDHNDYSSLPVANIAHVPVVVTMHGPFDAENRHIYQKLLKPYIVTISKSQAVIANIHHAGTVYNGLAMEDYPFSAVNDGYLLYVGRISMEKGVHLAIEVALNLHLPLIIAAKLDEADRPYFHEYIESYLSEDIQWINEVDEEQRNKLMSRALCFLHPVTWREPFGLTLIEAQATGCPVVAFNKGSIPELIVDGKTGFVVNTVEEMIDAVNNIGTIDRAECRRHALTNFNSKIMAKGYEDIYKKILRGEI